jgi:ribosomal-protein-alanine N-acetyltransferase
MSAALHVTEAFIRDAPLLAAMHALCFPADPWDSEAMAGLLATPGLRGLLAAQDEPVALALIRYAADEAEILTFGVVPSARHQGMGGQMLDAVVRSVRRRGSRALFLEVAVDNAHARRLYAGRGFCEVGRRPGYYDRGQAPRQDALILKLAIGGGLGHDGREEREPNGTGALSHGRS